MLPMVTLDDFPRHRRAQLVWEWAHFGVGAVEHMVRSREGKPCMPRPGKHVLPSVVLGDDGRAHLLSVDRLLCARNESGRGWEHTASCHWLDGPLGTQEDEDVWGPAPAGLHRESAPVEWVVNLTREPADATALPRSLRCQGAASYVPHYWPPPPAKTASVRRMRAALMEDLGAACHLCGQYPGSMVDHDHATGLVRGLLCAFCNRTLEHCPHLNGCPKADYMNYPPAAHLQLLYPAHMQWKPKASTRDRKIELLGFDPFTDWIPADEADIAPPASAWPDLPDDENIL